MNECAEPLICLNGCACIEGYTRLDETNSTCIKISDCPRKDGTTLPPPPSTIP